MLGNTLVLTVAGTPLTLTKIREQDYSSEYMFKDALHQVVVRIRHSRTAATTVKPSNDRHNFEVVETVFATLTEPELQRKFYFVQEQKASDLNVALAASVCDWATAATNANLASLLGWES